MGEQALLRFDEDDIRHMARAKAVCGQDVAQVQTAGSADIFVIEEAETASGSSIEEQHSALIASAHCVKERIQNILRPVSHFHQQLTRSAQHYMDAVWRDEGSRDVALVATCLANAGYRVTIRTAKGGGSGRTCFDNLRHCHILVLPDDSNSSDDAFIVDICFRDQFQMRRPTPLYEAVLDAVPQAFIGNRAQLLQMLVLLSDHMAQAFQDNREACPPWRRYCALVSKWLPKESKKEEVVVGGESDAVCLKAADLEGRSDGTSTASSRKDASLLLKGSSLEYKTRQACCFASPDTVLAHLAPCALCSNLPMVNLPGFDVAESRQGAGTASSQVPMGTPALPCTASGVAPSKVTFSDGSAVEKLKQESARERAAVQWDTVFNKEEVPPPQYTTGSILSHAVAKGLSRGPRGPRGWGSPPGLWQGPPFYHARGGARSSCDGTFRPVGRLQHEILQRRHDCAAPALF